MRRYKKETETSISDGGGNVIAQSKGVTTDCIIGMLKPSDEHDKGINRMWMFNGIKLSGTRTENQLTRGDGYETHY